MSGLVHDGARQLLAGALAAGDRVLVTGASGWFGRTAIALMDGLPNPRLMTASRGRLLEVGSVRQYCEAWDWERVRDFAPTVIIDCAFLTRDLAGSMSLDEYVERNTSLTANLLSTTALESVARVVTISSGAAVHPVDALTQPIDLNPYGYLKRQAEVRLAELAAERGISVSVARAWSVSGAFVLKPRSYALSDMILQARAGRVHITASVPVYRRYVSVEDLLAVAVAGTTGGGASVIDSGGDLVEMQELAEAVVGVVNPAASISRAEMTVGEPNRYYASPEGWNDACSTLGFRPAELGDQIRVADNGLRRD